MNKNNLIDLRNHGEKYLTGLLKRGIELKNGETPKAGKNKNLAMIFTKPSTRTNVSFHIAMKRLGGDALYLGSETLQLSRGETIYDTSKTLGGYVDAIMIRTYSHRDVIEMGKAAGVPVINGLTDLLHPCQAMGDVMSIAEVKGFDFENLKVSFIGDGNNVCNSLINAAGIFGFQLSVASPENFEPADEIISPAQKKNPNIEILNDPVEASKDADAIYTDVWVSMGDEQEQSQRLEKFSSYRVDTDLLEVAKSDVMVMHCLPAHRGEEITDEVMDGEHSYVFEQAENRMHIQQAILEDLLKEKG
ncbi:MAG: ornithine carbamoyltransferase [Elusimicrobiota bacterium]